MSDTNPSKVHSEHTEKQIHHSSTQNTRLVKRMQKATFLIPFLVSILILVATFVIQKVISKQQHDATIINISGRQRMLSQNIAKHSAYLTITKGEQQVTHINSLNKSLALFKESHQNLTQKSKTLNFSDDYKPSTNIKNLYDSLEIYYQGLIKGADNLLAVNILPESPEKTEKLNLELEKIERNESAFLPIMNTIVFAYDEEGQEKITRLRIMQASIAFLVIVFIISLSFFGLR